MLCLGSIPAQINLILIVLIQGVGFEPATFRLSVLIPFMVRCTLEYP